ncbi:MAG TPA: carboxypeptidase regulatory-like domain-containing protein [Pyrinomonadaceae bacterium]|mgnify:CR=1 FL=1|nr:carboxypeptidase regulatory-like domain-containing protein [Pyrinomonadaceae bacterium]
MKRWSILVFFLTVAVAVLLSQFPRSKALATEAVVGQPQFMQAVAAATSARADSFGTLRSGKKGPPTVRGISHLQPAASATAEDFDRTKDDSSAKFSPLGMSPPSLSFDGLSNFDNIDAFNLLIIPPDMNGDVGPNHYVQTVNTLVRVYNKSGQPMTQPFKLSSLFAPLNTVCSTRDDGLPIVLYDPLADRWLISQYCNAFPPFRQLVAVSKTGDPTGQYHVYEFAMPNVRIHDFVKFGVWPDGYYMSSEEFIGADFSGHGMFAFDRQKMLAGDPTAGFIYFNRSLPVVSTVRKGNFLPADLDGLRPPPANAPGLFITYLADEYGDAFDGVRLFEFRANFADPPSSTFVERPESPWEVAEFDPTSPPDRTDIAQPAPGERLDSNSDRFSYRLAYRNYGASESLVVAKTVRVASDPYRAGIRVYELRRNNGGPFAITEQSTIGTNDASRWIGSAAQDNQGNIAVGYNFASEQKRPSVLYSGRLSSEPAGTFRTEGSLVEGTGVQKAFGWRWGDYSSLVVDPVDDCTFWQTGEYYTLASETFSDFTWLSRIGRFKFNECTPGPSARFGGGVSRADNSVPIEGATITAVPYSRRSDQIGAYGFVTVIPGAYTITVSAPGYRSQTTTVSLVDGETRFINFSLQPIAVFASPVLEISNESCGTNGSPDPGENVTFNLSLANTGLAAAQNLVATLQNTGGVTAATGPQNYGTMPIGGQTVSRSFSFTVSPTVACGGEIVLTFRLQDGVNDIGNLVVNLRTGKPRIAFSQNFDRTISGGLPVRWTRTFEGGGINWAVSPKRSQSGLKAVYSPDPFLTGLNEIQTPVFSITTTSGKLSFRNWYEFETTFLRNRLYDGSVLEIKIGDGQWQDIIAAGGVFESGGYDGALDGCCSNPLAGRQGWSGRSGINQTSEFITTTVRLPATAALQRVQLRFRVGTDIGGTREGQYVDNFEVTDGYVCSCVLP